MDESAHIPDNQAWPGPIPLTEFGKPANPYQEKLKGIFGEFSPDPKMWLKNSVLIDAVAQAVPASDKGLFVEALVDGMFTKFRASQKVLEEVYFGDHELPDDLSLPAQAKTQLGWSGQMPAEFVTLFWKNTLKTAVRLDKQMAIDTISKYHDFPNADFVQGFMAGIASEFPFMRSEDMLIDPDGHRFHYHHQDIELDPRHPLLTHVYKAREITYDRALLLEDRQGKPLAILHPPLYEAGRSEPAIGEILDARAYHDKYSYGVSVTLEEIKALLDHPDFADSLPSLSETNLNQTIFPMEAKARLRNLLSETENQAEIGTLFQNYGFQALTLFQLFEKEELMETIRVFNKCAQMGRRETVFSIVRDAYTTAEFASVYLGQSKTENPILTELLENKLTGQLREFVALTGKSSESLTPGDEKIITRSFAVLGKVAQAATMLSRKEDISEILAEANLPPRHILDLFEFSGRHPGAKTVFQTSFDFTMCVAILRQRNSPYAGKIAEMKREFYRKYNEDNKMNEAAATTDTPTDIARAASIVEHLADAKELPGNMRILLGGCGNCRRFELPFIQRLKDHKVSFSSIVAVDGTDFSSQIPPEFHGDPNFRFLNMNLEDPRLKAQGKFDVVILPWSVINDMVEKEGLFAALQVFKGLVKEGGILLTDQPIPVGAHSYFQTIEAQADLGGVWGIMERDFELANGDKARSIFDIMHIRELIMHGYHAGFVPVNFPQDPGLQQRICDGISKNDEALAQIHASGADLDAYSFPFWQSTTGWNRATFGWRFVGEEGVRKQSGFTPSLLIKALYG